MPDTKRVRIGVVGGGSIATSFVHHVVQALKGGAAPPIEIVVFERQPECGRGIPYQRDQDSNLLNVFAARMTAIAGEPTRFLAWLQRNGLADPAVDADRFYPRHLFGTYLTELFDQTRVAAEGLGVAWRVVNDEVTRITPAGGQQMQIATAGGDRWVADHVILCIGSPQSAIPSALAGHPLYFHTPYPTAAFAGIPADATVAVLGTSLTAVDAVVALQARGHTGPIHMSSRKGRLPCVRRPPAAVQLKQLQASHLREAAARGGGRLTLDQLKGFFVHDLLLNGGSPDEWADATRPTRGAAEYLAQEIEAAVSRSRTWLAVMGAFTQSVDVAWSLLPLAERRAWIAEFREQWVSRVTTVPIENATRIKAMVDAGQLTVGRGFSEVRCVGDAMWVVEHRDGDPVHIPVDAVINATGSPHDVRQHADRLVRAMLEDGVAVPDEFGGFAVNPETGRLRDAQGNDVEVVPLGALSAGAYFWINQLSVNARFADAAARRLVARLTNVPASFEG